MLCHKVLIMAEQCREYQNALAHKDVSSMDSKCDRVETHSQELEVGKKKVKITIEFPCTVDPKDADRFEHMLKEIYMNKIQKEYLQTSFHAVPCPPPKGKNN